MALLNKLFFPTTTKSGASPSSSATSWNTSNKYQNQSSNTENYLGSFPFDDKQVRILLFRECDNRGRRLLFDSNAMQKVTIKERKNKPEKLKRNEKYLSKNRKEDLITGCEQQQKDERSSSFIEVCEDYNFKHVRPNAEDITNIGEIVFGALAMSFQGTSLKVHWLQSPPRMLCSQVFLTPFRSSNNQPSPYSTISINSLATPRTSISSEQSSIDGVSIGSYSMPFSICSVTPNDKGSSFDGMDPHSSCTNSDIKPRYSSTYSNATDSGYSGISRRRQSSDQWSSSYQYSARSSFGSVLSEQSEHLRKFSIDSSIFPLMNLYNNVASDGCLQKRVHRNLRTSFEYENSVNDFIGFTTDNYIESTKNGGSEGGYIGDSNCRRASYSAQESHSNPEINKRRDIVSIKSLSRRPKLGLAVCITMTESFEQEMELFCSEHIALLESMLCRLRACTERAYIQHKDFLQIMYQAWLETKQWINDLFTAPRLKCPVWLNITSSGNKNSKNVAERFVKELCWLLSSADTKDTNFFISTVVTAILTHHLGWVSTVTAFHSTKSVSEISTVAIEQRARLLQVSQKHPYNALWAQMGDLYGSNGLFPKLSRTIVYGTEKLSLERLLNVLSYFIRCTEVRRSFKHEDFNKTITDSAASQNNSQLFKESPIISNFKPKTVTDMKKSLPRTQTCKQNINMISNDLKNVDNYEKTEDVDMLNTLKKNEIPNVLAFRDSRFVQQELRIGNYLMDTGIERSSFTKQSRDREPDNHVRLLLTTPDNIELNVGEDISTKNDCALDGAVEAIEIETSDISNNEMASCMENKSDFFWNMIPEAIKEGISLNHIKQKKSEQSEANRKQKPRISNHENNFNKNQENSTLTKNKHETNLSLSDLITQNSIGNCARMTWGIEPIKNDVSIEEQIYFDYCQKNFEKKNDNFLKSDNKKEDRPECSKNDNGVVFVLGENEPLVNLKKSMDDLSVIEEPFANDRNLCSLHKSTHLSTNLKKHSGVKFNFEQFPQIATNYMRSKNLVMTNYELLIDKNMKLNLESNKTLNTEFVEGNAIQQMTKETVSCAVCNNIMNSYQTPSNATELELETEDVQTYQNRTTLETSSKPILHETDSTVSVDTVKESLEFELLKQVKETHMSSQKMDVTEDDRKAFHNMQNKKFYSQRGSISPVAAKCNPVNESLRLLNLPMSRTKEHVQEDGQIRDMRIRAGFVPSLFLNVYDHYVSDMVLQGTYAAPKIWEMNLIEDLVLSAHSATLISQPAENIGIIADMEKWNVRIVSSKTHCFPFSGCRGEPVGMSQLVSSMLETVQAMSCTGISAYDCLSYLESKLQEIYLQSDALAAFLLETDFCPLSTVTSALNLSENDVPLLLSIASIHTPQITKKCGISFR